MRIGPIIWVLSGLLQWMSLSAIGETSESVCIVCGESTSAGHAVLLDNHAYLVHEFSCRSVWSRARESGVLDEVSHPILPADPLFHTDGVRNTRLLPAHPPRGSGWVWAGFLTLAGVVSGTLSVALAKAIGRPLLAAFALGFLIPAVGMVLVPSLPGNMKHGNRERMSRR